MYIWVLSYRKPSRIFKNSKFISKVLEKPFRVPLFEFKIFKILNSIL
jgi:hypothetical protein